MYASSKYFTDASYLTNGYLETEIDWTPRIKNILLKDLPSFIKTIDEDDITLNFLIRESERTPRAILNTFDLFEQDTVNVLSSMLPRIYTIVPHVLLEDQIKDDNLKSIGSNLWKEELGCVEWLNSKEPKSIVYVNYGSITIMTPQQIIEFAWGLAKSENPFLWIIRLDLVGVDSVIVPFEFVTKTKDRGMLPRWCPQEEILKHHQLGVF